MKLDEEEHVPRFMRLSDVSKVTGLCGRTIYRLRKQGLFPEPIDLKTRTLYWRRDTFEQWLQDLPTKAAQIDGKQN